MNPGEDIINETYRQRKVDDLLLMAKVLASDQCLAVHIESILGNPELTHQPSLPCGNCPVCSNTSPFLTIKKEGTKSVLLDLFVCGERTLDGKPIMQNLVKGIKSSCLALWSFFLISLPRKLASVELQNMISEG